MIIVSQDKKSIYNFNNIKSVDIVENEIYITDDILMDEGAKIGEYATEERAKEVLDEIAEQYEHEKDCKCDRSYLATLDNFTYRMPQE